jgi:hypothetical protein
MAGVTPRNSPNSLFSGIPGPEIPRSPFRGRFFGGKIPGADGSFFLEQPLALVRWGPACRWR